jgi:glycerophosphoryl diester phosphodiesterase
MMKAVTVLIAAGVATFAGAEPLTMQNIAHRGLWDKQLPQNTVEAIKGAYEAGATWVETDFHHTKAGQMVCIHAAKELKMYTGCKKKIVDLTPEDVATLNLGSKDKLPQTYRIPLLDQVLAVVPKHGVLQAEIKGYSPQYADIFEAAVKAAGLTSTNIVVSSFHYDALKDFKARYPKYRTVWLTGLKKDKPFAVQEYIAKCKAANIEVFCPGCGSTMGVMTRADADAVRAAGLEFRMFGVNSLKDLRQAKELGAVGFTCNFWRQAFDWAQEIGGITLLK